MKRILLVEDNFDFADNLQELCSFRGMEAVAASSGEAALELVAGGERFDVMLTDLRLPGISGVQLITQLRALERELRTFEEQFGLSPRSRILLGVGHRRCVDPCVEIPQYRLGVRSGHQRDQYQQNEWEDRVEQEGCRKGDAGRGQGRNRIARVVLQISW